MRSQLRIYFLWFAGLLFLQVVVLQNLNASIWFYPYAYPMLLLMLPKNSPQWLLLVVGFLLGSVVDVFVHAYGAHAFACTLIAYVRPFILNPLLPRDGSSDSIEPSLKNLGMQKYLTYNALLLFILHLTVFFIEEFSLTNLFLVLSQAVTSTALGVFIIVVLEFIFKGKK